MPATTQTAPRILIADDEEAFLSATADLLRGEGYDCACAADGPHARGLLEEGHFDLLIADIKMHGNADLELIRDLPQVARGMPAILITGYPTVESAVRSIELSVTAYLLKPLDFDELLVAVRKSLELYQHYQLVVRSRERSEHWSTSLSEIERMLSHVQYQEAGDAVSTLIDLSLARMLAAVGDLRELVDSGAFADGQEDAEHLAYLRRIAALDYSLRDGLAQLADLVARCPDGPELEDLKEIMLGLRSELTAR